MPNLRLQMRSPVLLIAFVVPIVCGAEPIAKITTVDGLKRNIAKRVVLEGVYNSPGKGSRSVDCGFIRLRIQDYSFKSKTKEGLLLEQIKSGQRIRFVAEVRYFKGRKSLVKTHPVVQEALPPKQIIDGEEYYVYPPSYSIVDAKLVEVIEHDEEIRPTDAPEPKNEQKIEPSSKSKVHSK